MSADLRRALRAVRLARGALLRRPGPRRRLDDALLRAERALARELDPALPFRATDPAPRPRWLRCETSYGLS